MSNSIWKNLINELEFKEEISLNGYSNERKFADYKIKYNIEVRFRTPEFLSIDLYSKQPKELRDLNYYIIRTGRGNFIVFDENRYRKPYLNLDLSRAEELSKVL